ncbi:zinc ribbon domain-containing protein [Myxococcota bacterium]|nr:zinc ribbon domain-containing protein [Myxococcota bacterium]MBU1536911.1 zinc ribbon domain-containing protein [Myxococcota bacterium]
MASKTTLYFSVPAEPLFDRFLEHYRGKGFHIEEADRVDMTINLANDSAMGFLFGLGKKRIFADFDPTDEGSRVTLSVKGGEAFLAEVSQLLEIEAQAISKQIARQTAQYSPRVTPQMIIMKETVHKETVKIPCSYCGELVENTVAKCPYCGAGLR